MKNMTASIIILNLSSFLFLGIIWKFSDSIIYRFKAINETVVEFPREVKWDGSSQTLFFLRNLWWIIRWSIDLFFFPNYELPKGSKPCFSSRTFPVPVFCGHGRAWWHITLWNHFSILHLGTKRPSVIKTRTKYWCLCKFISHERVSMFKFISLM